MKVTKQIQASIRKWVEDLRSGKYKQTQKTLQDKHGFCCLGVAMETQATPKRDEYGFIRGDLPPADVRPEWLPVVNNDFYRRTEIGLVELNDVERLTFDEIADCLEAVYLLRVLE